MQDWQKKVKLGKGKFAKKGECSALSRVVYTAFRSHSSLHCVPQPFQPQRPTKRGWGTLSRVVHFEPGGAHYVPAAACRCRSMLMAPPGSGLVQASRSTTWCSASGAGYPTIRTIARHDGPNHLGL